jgi:cytochrome P450
MSTVQSHRTGAFEMPPNYPADVLRITRYGDAVEILRNPDFAVEPLGHDAPMREGTLLKLDGPVHLARRRAANRLVRREWHENYRSQVLLPTVARRLRALADQPGEDGLVRIDLVHFSRRLFVDMAAAITGLGASSEDDFELLTNLIEPMHSGSIVKWFANHEQVMEAALEAAATFRAQFFEPSLHSHRALAEQAERGELDKNSMPLDLMTLIVTRADPAWADEDLALRTVIFYLGGASNTHVRPLGFAVDELTSWLAEHPEDRGLLADQRFMGAVVNETLRMYGNTPAIFRIAQKDMTLASGLAVRNGQYVAIDTRLTGRDVGTYGEDANVFDPRRTIPAEVTPFGLAFGGGRHMCQGVPIVLGSEGINGTLIHVLSMLFAAGVRPDPSRPPVKVPERDTYEVYPVTLDTSAIQSATSAI